MMKIAKIWTWTYRDEDVEGRFLGRDIIDKPVCAFCGLSISPPEENTGFTVQEMPVGRCSCGAVYVCDVTGHNLGNAMVEALVNACGGDWDAAWELLPEKDYEEKRIENYDPLTHLIVHGGAYEGRRISGVLFFIRLKANFQGPDQQKPPSGLKVKSREKVGAATDPATENLSKSEVEELVQKYDIDPIIQRAYTDKKLMRHLKRLLYSVEPLIRKRSAEFLGKVSAEIAYENPEIVTKFLQGLFSSLTDSASSSWGYLYAIGEIIGGSPDLLAGYVPRLFQFLRDRSLLPEALTALGKICETRPELLRKNRIQFLGLLEDRDHAVRGYSAVLLGNLGADEAKEGIEKLVNDSSEIEIYRNGKLEYTTVGNLALEAIEKL